MELVDCKAEGFLLRLHRICQVEYVIFDDTNFYGRERNIYHNCVDNIGGGRFESE